MVIAGSVCLVTGASSGIGRALAEELARRRAATVLVGRDRERLEAVARATGGRALVADLRDPRAVERVAEEAGAVDILVNNAGVGWAGAFSVMPSERIEELVAVNLLAPAVLSRLLLEQMVARGRGRIVNVASIAGHVGVRDEAVYAATKAGLIALSESLQQELARSPVGVTLVSPGVIDTPLFERRGLPYDRRFPRPMPAARLAAAIARAIERDASLVIRPRWLAAPVRVHGLTPRLYRMIASRFG